MSEWMSILIPKMEDVRDLNDHDRHHQRFRISQNCAAQSRNAMPLSMQVHLQLKISVFNDFFRSEKEF